ncbi:MAG: hypothetical protein KAF41_13500, partial [Flavobacterium sp.]|nr:hypothetical protein [Flavobacterium sp.]
NERRHEKLDFNHFVYPFCDSAPLREKIVRKVANQQNTLKTIFLFFKQLRHINHYFCVFLFDSLTIKN